MIQLQLANDRGSTGSRATVGMSLVDGSPRIMLASSIVMAVFACVPKALESAELGFSIPDWSVEQAHDDLHQSILAHR